MQAEIVMPPTHQVSVCCHIVFQPVARVRRYPNQCQGYANTLQVSQPMLRYAGTLQVSHLVSGYTKMAF